MKTRIKSIFAALFIVSFFLTSCGSGQSASSSSNRGVHHYHHGHPGYHVNPYYGRDVIIIDDGIDIDEPIAVPYAEEY